MRYNDALEWGEGVIANDVFKMRKIIEFLFTTKFMFVSCYIQSICAGEVTVVIVIDK